MRYLDPKNDLIFKRVFGEHANILKSFLNALLPLPIGEEIVHVEYLPIELVPELPIIIKNSLVDVRCFDNQGRQFIVEMQMLWTDSFKSRVLFNAAKAFVRQLHKGVDYKGLKPVYALSIVNDTFEPDIETYYHHYKFVHNTDGSKILEGLQLVFVELPKFKAKAFNDKKISLLWLRFLKEIQKGNDMLNEDLIKELQTVPEIAEALELTKESAYSPAQLEVYDKYWDNISIEKTFIVDAEAKGKAEGIEIGIEHGIELGKEQGIELGIEKGEQVKNISVILNAYDNGAKISFIATITSLTEEEVIQILKTHKRL